MKAEEACLKVEKEFEHICVYFSCENTDGLLKGGRVGPVARKLFKTFKIKPIINVDTTNHLAGIGKSFDGIITKIITLIKKQFDGTMDASNILHIGILNGYTSQERINHIIKKVKHAFNVDDSVIEVNYIPTTVLVHTYKGSYGIAVECSLKRKTIL
jgi:fatty acid-binding protein DegV